MNKIRADCHEILWVDGVWPRNESFGFGDDPDDSRMDTGSMFPTRRVRPFLASSSLMIM